MIKKIKSFEIIEDEGYPKIFIDGELYENCGLIMSIEVDPLDGYTFEIKYRPDPPIIRNNTVLKSTDIFYIDKGM